MAKIYHIAYWEGCQQFWSQALRRLLKGG